MERGDDAPPAARGAARGAHGGGSTALHGLLRRAARTRAGRLALALRSRTFGSGRAGLFELDRPAGPIPPSRAAYPDGYRFRRAGRHEAAACARVAGLPEAEALRRFDGQDRCYVVAQGERLATVIWVHDGPCYVRGLGYLHAGPPGTKYVYGIATDPAERGRGLYRNALLDLAASLFASGATRLVQIVADGNAPVLRTIPGLGYRLTRRIRSVLLLGVRRTVVTRPGRRPDHPTWRLAVPTDHFVI